MKQEKKAHKEALAELREKFFDELETTLYTLIGIRDGLGVTTVTCPKCKHKHTIEMTKDKDRIDASKAIAKLLGGWLTEKTTPKEEKKVVEFKFTETQNDKIDQLVEDALRE